MSTRQIRSAPVRCLFLLRLWRKSRIFPMEKFNSLPPNWLDFSNGKFCVSSLENPSCVAFLALFLPTILPLQPVTGKFTGEITHYTHRLHRNQGGARLGGLPPQAAGSAAALPRLRLLANCRVCTTLFWPNSPARPGSARPRPGVPPLAPRRPLDAASVRHSPRCAVTASRGVASCDQPQERDRFPLPPATGRRLLPGVGPGSLFRTLFGALSLQFLHTFFAPGCDP